MSSTNGAGRRRPRVVVIGGGFGGLAAGRQLSVADVDVLLVDRQRYNTFQPLLYQVATGGLNPGDVTFALRAFTSRFSNADFLRGTVVRVDADAKVVHLDQHEPVEYDYLIISCGVTANYFGIPGAQKHALAIYTRAGAIATRDRVLTAIENANQKVPGAPEPTIVVVGGGATGVEMAGALAELRNAAVPIAYRQLDPERVRIVLVEMVDYVLGPFHPKLREYAAKQLRKRGVELRLSTSLKEVREDCVVVERPDGEREEIECAVVVWATGITASPIVGGWGLPTGRGGRIQVGADLRVEGYPEIFAVGDVALDDENLPQVAQ